MTDLVPHSWFEKEDERVAKMNELFPSLEGNLLKKTKKDSDTYEERFVILEGRNLRYYKVENENRILRGSINFPLYSV
jgi:hypothetical protein